MSTSKRGFAVAHQRVALEVDIFNEKLKGNAELTVVPTSIDLKTIVLDARRMTIEKCYVNGIEAKFTHIDLLTVPPKHPKSWGSEQYRIYRNKIESLVNMRGDCAGSELSIELPESVEISEPKDATFIASHSTKEKSYEPLTVRVFYHTNNNKELNVHNEGLHFVTKRKEEAHVYTTHTPIGQATSCWLPCVDGLWSLSTWELEFHIPQLLDYNDPESELVIACNNTMPNEEPDPQNENNKIVKFDIFTPVSSQHIGFAIGPFKQIPVTQSNEKRRTEAVVNDAGAPASAPPQSAGGVPPTTSGTDMQADGNISQMNNFPSGMPLPPSSFLNNALPNTNNNSNNNNNSTSTPNDDSNQKQIMAFVLPSKAKLINSTCAVFPKAMNYMLNNFGTPLFDSYSLCFVSDYPGLTKYSGDAYALTIFSDALLYESNIIEPKFDYCEVLVRGLAAQWCGVSIVPATWNDLWVTEGIALFMTNLFIKKLMGNNEFRFRMKRANDRLCREDIEMPPVGAPRFRFPLMPDDLNFIRLKAPLVLFILDRRMTKTDRNFGVPRVLSKLFMQSMSGDLKSQLSTFYFMRQCEKIAHYRLQKFFDEWVYGSGYPIFRITQRFNKKRTCIEMGIAQVHSTEMPKEVLNNETFLSKAITEIREEERIEEIKSAENLRLIQELAGMGDDFINAESTISQITSSTKSGGQQKPNFLPVTHFLGPMTIRIHEANGTPYEHVVDLRDQFTKIDIPYNTKYKRLRRNQKFRRSSLYRDGSFPLERAYDGGYGMMNDEKLINCMGDVLMSDYEVASWKFVDWGDGVEEEEVMFNEAFEWLRADADFEWLGQFFVSQPDYMYASQLQQDRDVVAQYDAVRYFGRQQANPIYGTVLTRTIMDSRYYYGVRVAAVEELRKLAVPQVQYVGMTLLLRIFRELYCLGESKLPKANDFRNFPSYFVQKAIPKALSLIRDQVTGRCPIAICNFILDLIRYNENSENLFSDTYYTACLLESAANTVRPVHIETGELVVKGAVVSDIIDDPGYRQFLSDVIAEIDKCQRLDQWLPSPNHFVTCSAIKIEELLVMAGYGQPRLDKLLTATEQNEAPEVRLAAISSLLNVGAYRSAPIMDYLLDLFKKETSYVMHRGIFKAVASMLGNVAMYGECVADKIAQTDKKFMARLSNPMEMRSSRQQALARQSVQTAIPILRETLKNVKPLQNMLWAGLTSNQTGSYDRRLILEMCELIHEPIMRYIAKMNAPPLFELSMKRKRDYVFVVKYRSILNKKAKHAGDHVDNEVVTESVAEHEEDSKPVKLKLKLK